MFNFWGLLIQPGREYDVSQPYNLRLSSVTFGDDTVADSKTKLYLCIDKVPIPIATLIESKIENVPLSTLIPVEAEDAFFYVTGPNSVYVHGEVEIDESSDDFEYSDEGSDSEEISEDELNSESSEEIEMVEEVKPAKVAKKAAAVELKKLAIDQAPKTGKRKSEPVKDSEAESKPTAPESKPGKSKPETVKTAEPKKGKSETQKPPEAKKAKTEAPKKGEAPKDKNSYILPGGLKVYDHTVGTGAVAKTGSKISVHYIGKLSNGKVFDRSDKPFTFKLGQGLVIKGWDLGCVGLMKGGERKLTIPPALAYGKKGSHPIPKNATLTFDIKCVKVHN